MEVARLSARRSLAWSKQAGTLFLLFCMTVQCGCTESGKPAERGLQEPSPSAQGGSKANPAAALADPASDTIPAQPPAPGHYATDRGWGLLTIEPERESPSSFSLETVNAGYGCSFSGTLRGTQGTVYDGNAPGTCTLEVVKTQDGVAIHSATGMESACREYCGNNGSFEGDYLKLGATCEPAAVEHARAAFQALYDRKDYAKAAATLAPVYRECLATSSFTDEGAIRNDYAITRHRLGEDAACLEALAPYRDAAGRSDDEITGGMAPAVVDDYLTVIHAARTNLKLCGRAPAH